MGANPVSSSTYVKPVTTGTAKASESTKEAANTSNTTSSTPRQVVVPLPVKPGETVWDAQARLEGKSDLSRTVTGTSSPIGKPADGIESFYSDASGNPTGRVSNYNASDGSGRSSTTVTEYDANSNGRSGTSYHDDDNNGSIDRKTRFCTEG